MTLTGKDELRAALSNPEFVCDVCTRVESTYLMRLIVKIIRETEDTAYNASVYQLACQELELDYAPYHTPEKNETLGWLVYWAQEFYRNHRDVVAGYQPLTQDLIVEAYNRKGKLEVKGDFQRHIYNPRLISGKYYAMKPGARNHYLRIYPGMQARIVLAQRG
jgi:hypothetical protein